MMHDIKTEKAVLGACLIENGVIAKVVNTLQPRHFSLKKHERIYEALFQLFEEGSAIDLENVIQTLSKEKINFIF